MEVGYLFSFIKFCVLRTLIYSDLLLEKISDFEQDGTISFFEAHGNRKWVKTFWGRKQFIPWNCFPFWWRIHEVFSQTEPENRRQRCTKMHQLWILCEWNQSIISHAFMDSQGGENLLASVWWIHASKPIPKSCRLERNPGLVGSGVFHFQKLGHTVR